MRRWIAVLLSFLVFTMCAWGAGKPVARFKAVEVKHFQGNEGVDLTTEFYDFLYGAMKAELVNTKLFTNVIGDGEAVDAADASQSISIEGSILEYKKGNVVKERLIGYSAGKRSMRSHIKIVRVGDKQVLLDKDLKVYTSAFWDNKSLASFLAKNIAKECKKNLKK